MYWLWGFKGRVCRGPHIHTILPNLLSLSPTIQRYHTHNPLPLQCLQYTSFIILHSYWLDEWCWLILTDEWCLTDIDWMSDVGLILTDEWVWLTLFIQRYLWRLVWGGIYSDVSGSWLRGGQETKANNKSLWKFLKGATHSKEGDNTHPQSPTNSPSMVSLLQALDRRSTSLPIITSTSNPIPNNITSNMYTIIAINHCLSRYSTILYFIYTLYCTVMYSSLL